MKKLFAALLLGLASFVAIGVNAANYTPSQEPQAKAQTQQVEPCNPQNYCGPQVCGPTNCYTDTVCNPTPCNPVPCAPVPCYTDSTCAPAPCFAPVAPNNTPAQKTTTTTNSQPTPVYGCGGC